MTKKRVVAYIGTYTFDDSPGIFAYEVKKDGEFLSFINSYNINNPSYICLSKDGQNLYSVVDEGVASFMVDKSGELIYLNTRPTGGMRGCYLAVDSEKRYLFVAGYHDGRVSMIKLKKDGSISGVADGIFHQGHAISASERRIDHPKVSCVVLSPDEKYLCAADYGMNQIRIYRIDYDNGKMIHVDIVRCALDSPPRTITFSKDGKFLYILTESTNQIEVYSYKDKGDNTDFELIERVPVYTRKHIAAAPTFMFITEDDKHIVVAVDGDNSVIWFDRNKKTGKITHSGDALISGTYPKYIAMIPGSDELMVLNHDSATISGFMMHFDKHYMLMCEKPVDLKKANCVCFREFDD